MVLVAVAAGGYYRIGLKSDGSIRKWGCNGPCPVPSPNRSYLAISGGLMGVVSR